MSDVRNPMYPYPYHDPLTVRTLIRLTVGIVGELRGGLRGWLRGCVDVRICASSLCHVGVLMLSGRHHRRLIHVRRIC
jgi:hypothetical protein